MKDAMVKETNKWVACARENGFPNLADLTKPKADDWETAPKALLPLTTTEVQLKGVLKKCPNVPPKVANSLEWPQIGFDAPGYDGTDSTSDLDEATIEKLDRLVEVLGEVEAEHFK
jgi:hypothetical protein